MNNEGYLGLAILLATICGLYRLHWAAGGKSVESTRLASAFDVREKEECGLKIDSKTV
jgi:hypothetical protein